MRHRLRACTSVRAWDPGDCRRALLCRGRDSGGPWCRVPDSVLLAQPLRKRRCTWPAALMGVDGVHAILCGGEEQPPPLVSIAVRRRWLRMRHGLQLGPHPRELEEVFNRGHGALGSAHNRRRSPGGLSVRLASAPCSLVSQSSHPSFPAILNDLRSEQDFFVSERGFIFFACIPKAGRQRPGRRLRLTRSGVRRSSTGLARGHSPAPGSSRVARRDPTCCSRLREVRADRSRSASPESGRHPQELA